MVLDVKSVDRLLGTPVPYAYAIKAGPWIFLTGHEAYDWETGTSDEVTGPPGFPLHGRQRSRRNTRSSPSPLASHLPDVKIQDAALSM